jgi:hypothetical protein
LCAYCREEAEAKRRKEIEEQKRAALLSTKVPIGKPTNAAILKAEKVSKVMFQNNIFIVQIPVNLFCAWNIKSIFYYKGSSRTWAREARGAAHAANDEAQAACFQRSFCCYSDNYLRGWCSIHTSYPTTVWCIKRLPSAYFSFV